MGAAKDPEVAIVLLPIGWFAIHRTAVSIQSPNFYPWGPFRNGKETGPRRDFCDRYWERTCPGGGGGGYCHIWAT